VTCTDKLSKENPTPGERPVLLVLVGVQLLDAVAGVPFFARDGIGCGAVLCPCHFPHVTK
jgi:hypothetical protein